MGLQLVRCPIWNIYENSNMLLFIDLASTAIIPKIPYMPAIFAHREGAPSRVDICAPSSSLRGFLHQTQQRQVVPYAVR